MADESDLPPGRPAVWVNCAVSLDGRLAFAGGVRARLSSAEDLVRVQRLRAESDGILIGVGTVLKDDPSLRVHWELLGGKVGRQPLRVVVDSTGRTPATARVLDAAIGTIVAMSERSTRSFPPHVRTIVAGQSRVDLALLFERLRSLGIRRLMVEGGSEILGSVLKAGLFDRLTVYYAPVLIGGSSAPSMVSGREAHGPAELVGLETVGLERLGEGFVATYVPSVPAGPPG
jgi:2,5-diamino-6-(ribosylamino)-4(3H)-pyrimidinone 5'-phosphate reductase